MNNSSLLQNFSMATESSSRKTLGDTPVEFRVLVGIIAVITIVANSFLILVLCKQNHMLKKPYNLVILYLAIADTLTGKYNLFRK